MLSKDVRIFVVMGGLSAERGVSLDTGAAVVSCLESAGYSVRAFDLSPELPRREALPRMLDEMRDFNASVVYLATHGPLGEDGTIQGALEMAGIPYNGSGVLASALGNDKIATKLMLVAARITTPRYGLVPKGAIPDRSPLPFPVIVKPRALGSSLGLSLVERKEEFAPAIEAAFSYGQDAMVEQFIAGREIQVSVIDGEPLPLIEVVSANRRYDFEAKYAPGKSEHKVPAPFPKKQYEAAQRLGVLAYQSLGCCGAARVEIMAENTGTLYVLEVNTLPGMTVTSLLPEAAREAGMSFLDLVLREIDGAIKRHGATVEVRGAAEDAGHAAASDPVSGVRRPGSSGDENSRDRTLGEGE